MLIDKTRKNIYQNIADYASISVDNTPLTAADVYLVEDDSPLAAKALTYFPDFAFVTDDNGELADIVQTEHIPTEEELRAKYEELAVSKIREQYSQTDEAKVVREALASGDYTEFDLYNEYVEQCKKEARLEAYGTDLA